MKATRPAFPWDPRDNLAVWVLGLTICSAASVALSVWFRDATLAILGSVGFALVAMGLGVWVAAHSARRAVADLRNNADVAWPLYAQTTRDLRRRRGTLVADEFAVTLRLVDQTVQLDWADVITITTQEGGLFRTGRLLIGVPTRGTLILEILASNAVVSLNDSEIAERAEVLRELKQQSVSQSNRGQQGN